MNIRRRPERGSVWRIAPPLTVTTADIDLAMTIFDQALTETRDGAGAATGHVRHRCARLAAGARLRRCESHLHACAWATADEPRARAAHCRRPPNRCRQSLLDVEDQKTCATDTFRSPPPASCSACWAATAASADALDDIKKKGVLVVGTKADYRPFGYLDPSGKIVGFEPDLAADVAKRLGVKLELVPVVASNRIQFLQQGKIDMMIATMSDTPERRKIVDIIEPELLRLGHQRPGAEVGGHSRAGTG